MPNISFNRIENLALPGIPDLLCYNKNKHFFTLEMKVAKSNVVRLSPHQIAFHVKHPVNSFIIVKSLASSCSILYTGDQVQELFARGLKLEPIEQGLGACRSRLEACGSKLET
jgi:hypothetical protein